ncbi:MAG TPA: hypothetical protein VMG13_10165 [Trebonia sp.]|nr:hypothetical protein [Trebonia sp.]
MRAAQGLQPRGVHAQPGQELQRLARLGRVDQVAPGADHDVIAEHGGYLAQGRGAAGEPHQRAVIDLPRRRSPSPARLASSAVSRYARIASAGGWPRARSLTTDRAATTPAMRPAPPYRKSKDQQTTSPRGREQNRSAVAERAQDDGMGSGRRAATAG